MVLFGYLNKKEKTDDLSRLLIFYYIIDWGCHFFKRDSTILLNLLKIKWLVIVLKKQFWIKLNDVKP